MLYVHFILFAPGFFAAVSSNFIFSWALGGPQLSQLDVAIREHKQEIERKVESLQQSLEARERELRDAQRELMDRNTKVRTQAIFSCVTAFIDIC